MPGALAGFDIHNIRRTNKSDVAIGRLAVNDPLEHGLREVATAREHFEAAERIRICARPPVLKLQRAGNVGQRLPRHGATCHATLGCPKLLKAKSKESSGHHCNDEKAEIGLHTSDDSKPGDPGSEAARGTTPELIGQQAAFGN